MVHYAVNNPTHQKQDKNSGVKLSSAFICVYLRSILSFLPILEVIKDDSYLIWEHFLTSASILDLIFAGKPGFILP